MATFQAADTNQDGNLNKAEYDDFTTKMTENAKARFGKAAELSAEDKDYFFGMMNSINPDTDGWGMAEMGLMMAAAARRKAEGN